ncbi:MAG TPA: hypothetical protein VE078_18060 [Thermoanaerobaculia bacterium]|nr:hypothetical protein [Thermoanaerobaculia bacterium]
MRRMLFTGLMAAVASLLSGASCHGDMTTEVNFLKLETIVQQSNPGQAGGTVREVVKDQAAWSALWAELRKGSGLPEEPPAVDFAREMVIVAAMETQSCVSRVTVKSAGDTGGELVVDILEEPPAPNCVCITAERPIHVVRLRRADAPPHFAVQRGQTNC